MLKKKIIKYSFSSLTKNFKVDISPHKRREQRGKFFNNRSSKCAYYSSLER